MNNNKKNKGILKGRRKKHHETAHKIEWSKVRHGPPKVKRNPDFWKQFEKA